MIYLGNIVNKDSSYIAGQTPINSSNNIENMGIAVFKKDVMVGELNGLESICHLIVSGKLKYCNIQIQDPIHENNIIDLRLELGSQPKTKLTLVNGYPYISENININVQINSINGDSDYKSSKYITTFENSINKYLENIIYSYLYKTAKDLNCDIDGFGKYAVKYFNTEADWNNYNWLDNYQNSFFKITVKSKIKSSSNFINS